MYAQVSNYPDQNDPSYARAVAIVGMSCRFPQANTLMEFWELLRQGKDAVGRIPPERWDMAAFYDPSPAANHKTHQRDSALLKDIHDFDPLFFSISPAEAAEMQPSQKLGLELVWEAIESSTIPFKKIQGQRIGVYVGNIWNDFEHYRRRRNAPVTHHSALGQSANIIANRVSFVYGFTGPSLVVDTGCSASLVALHLACQSLLEDDTTMAFAAGVNHLLDPELYIPLSKFGGLSAKGKCSAFDIAADGFVRGEGGGVLLLKKLSEAEKDGDRIYAIIRGTAVNNNGYNISLPATSVAAQKELLAHVYGKCGIAPHEVHYVEAHGTGTKVGDPTEAKAVGEFFSEGRKENKLRIGSVKTNIGHLEGAAGIAGVVKVVLSMQHKLIPASLHYQTPNPDIPFEALKLSVQHTLTQWPTRNGESLKAGVNSFGWGGTNAHAVIEEYKCSYASPKSALPVRSRYCLPLSAKSTAALKAYAKAYRQVLKNAPDAAVGDICTASAILKPTFDYRVLFTAQDKDELLLALENIIQGTDEVIPRPLLIPSNKIVMVFPGQGAQWLGMGRELFLQEPVFKDALEACGQAFKAYTDWSLLQELYAGPETSRLQEITVIQPILCAIQIALARLWISWGIQPHTVVGHSMGEVAAAHIAGILSLDDTARIICMRSHLMKKVSGTGGGMMVTELSPAEASEWIEKKYPTLSVAVNNSPKSTVLAGDLTTINKMQSALEQQGIFCRPVKVDVASHSQQMDPLKAGLKQALQNISPLPGTIPLFSTARNKMMRGKDLDADYWTDNLRNTVQFTSAMEYVMNNGHTVFIEVSPHPVLLNAVTECAAHFGKKVTAVASLYREKPEQAAVYGNLCFLFEQGYEINWEQFYQTTKAPPIPLPNYPFQRERFEIEDRSNHTAVKKSNTCFPLPEEPIPVADSDNERHTQQNQQEFLPYFLSLSSGGEKQAALEELLIRHVAHITKILPVRIKPSVTFKEVGIDSLMAVQLRNELQKNLPVKLPVSTFWSHPNLSAYASLLIHTLEEQAGAGKTGSSSPGTNGSAVRASDWLIIHQPRPAATCRLFCFHDAGGDTSLYQGWENRLGAAIELVAVELPGRGKRLTEVPYSDTQVLITDIIPVLLPMLDKPFLFFGHSMGGLLAFEIARELRKLRLPLPSKLFLSALPGLANYSTREVMHTFTDAGIINIFPHLDKIHQQNEELFQLLMKLLRSDLLLLNNYRYSPQEKLPIPLVVIHGKDDNRVTGKQAGEWRHETSLSTKIISRPGGHRYIEHDHPFLTALIQEAVWELLLEK